MTYAKFGTILLITIICGGMLGAGILFAYTNKSPEELLEKNNLEQVKKHRDKIVECEKSATGTSREILEKLDACKDIQKPELQMIINYSGSVERVSEGIDPEIVKMGKITTQFMVIDETHKKICDKQINSPLCKDKELLARLYKITEDRIPGNNMFPILIGITNAESSLGLNFANDKIGGKCNGRNNWGGIKYQILDNNTRVYARNLNGFDYKNSSDQYGCNLYPFESIEEFWTTKVNGMRFGYKNCIESKTPIKCISYKYVGNPNISEKSWINNVSEFLL